MTLVMVLYADSCPMVVCDSLISAAKGARPGGVPNPLREPEARQADGFHPLGLARKFWLLPDESLFCYAGSVRKAASLYEQLCGVLSTGHPYDVELHREAQSTDPKCRELSFLVVTPGNDRGLPSLYYHGNELPQWHDTYGRVVSIGWGGSAAQELLALHPGKSVGGFEDMVLNAHNAAARLTLDYMRLGNSKMARASSGGYFEVLMPWLYRRDCTWAYRGSGHAFIEVTPDRTSLRRLVLSRQTNDETEVLTTGTIDIELDSCAQLIVPVSVFSGYRIAMRRANQACAPFSGEVPFSHLMAMTLYGECSHPECGHSFRAHTVSFGFGFPAATVLEHDSFERDFGVAAGTSSRASSLVVDMYDPAALGGLVERLQMNTQCKLCHRSRAWPSRRVSDG